MKIHLNIKKAILSFTAAIAMTAVFLTPITVNAPESFAKQKDPLADVQVISSYAILMDADSGNILYNKGGDETIYPASTSKILTAIVALENSEPDDVVTVSQNALKGQENNGAHVGLKAGETLPMKDAIYAMMLESANDAAIAIAETISGSEEKFAVLLNEKAKDLGLENSHFVTPNGLFAKDHYTSAKDLATITRYAMENKEFMEVFSSYKYVMEPTNMRPGSHDIYTSHKMTKFKSMEYDGIIGGKTGYIDESKCNVVTAAKRNGITLICVTAKCNSIIDSYNDTIALFDAGFNTYAKTTVKPLSSQQSFEQMIKEEGYIIRHSVAEANEIQTVLPKDADTSQVTFKLVDAKTSLPLKKNRVTGQIQAIYDGDVVGSIDLKAENDLGYFGFVMSTALKVLLYGIVVLAVLILALRIYFTQKKRSRNKKKNMKKGSAA